MKMRKKFSLIASVLLLSLMFCIPVLAEEVTTKTWSYSNYNYGSYVPKTGKGSASFAYSSSSGNYAITNVNFTLDSNNVSAIKAYNNGTNSSYSGRKGYLGLDVTSVRNGSTDMMDAYSISTSLPNPKTDLENDDLGGTRNEESEVVALGTVSASYYYMSTYWNDYRSGGSSDSGKFQAQFNISEKGVIDYNNMTTSSRIQATIPYGTQGGKKIGRNKI